MNKNILFLTAIVLATTCSYSQEQKKLTLNDLLNRVSQESRGAKLNTATKKSTAVPGAQSVFSEKQIINLDEVKPTKSNYFYKYSNADQEQYEKTLDMQIDELFKLTQKFGNKNNRGELWLRLAELYVEKAGILEERKQGEYDRQLKLYQAGKTVSQPKLDLSESLSFNKKAVQLYEWFVRDFPNDPKMPQALFFLGYNHFELGNQQQGLKYYNHLTGKYPESTYSPEAHFAMGENFFEDERWADAYKQYTYLIKDNKHNLHTIALYKSAWCLYRLGKTDNAIKYLDFIVKAGRSGDPVGTSGKKLNSARLENEALKDLVVFFADEGDADRALNYFRKMEPNKSKEYIERLAYYLVAKGNGRAAKEVFKYLINQEPLAKNAFEYQYQIVQNNFYAKNVDEFKTEMMKWVAGYGAKSDWYKKNAGDSELIKRSTELREQTLRNYILQQHQTAQNTRAVFSQTNAEEGYKIYFQEFPNSKTVGDMHFFYGELLYDMNKYSEATSEYMLVVNNYPQNQYAEKASQNILLSAEKALPKDEDFQKKADKSLEPLELESGTRKFIETANWYLQKYPNSERAPEIKFRIGRLYYLTNNFEPAEKSFKEIVQKYPKTKFSEYSANLLLDMYSLKKDYVGLEKVGAELLSEKTLSEGKVGDDIRGVLEKASFKKAQSLEAEKKYLESAKQYQSFGLQNSKSNLRTFAFFNAGVNFERSGKNKEAAVNYKRVLSYSDRTDGQLKIKSKKLLAKIYQESGLFDEAGKLYYDLARENAQDDLKHNYLFNSALMMELTGKKDEATKEYEKYLAENKNSDENAEIIFKLAGIYYLKSNYSQSSQNYRKYLGLPQAQPLKKIEAHYNLYIINKKTKQNVSLDETTNLIKTLITKLPAKAKGEANTYLAKLSLMKANEYFDELRMISLPADEKKQKKAVDAKLNAMKKINDQLALIIKLDSAVEIVSALYMLGEANEHMAWSFKQVPVPKKLNAEQKKLYLIEVEKIVSPFLNKADESYKLTVERGRELQVYGEQYSKAYAKLNARLPQDFYYSGEKSADSKQINWRGVQ